MAKFNSYVLGKVTKSLGNITMCYMNRQNIAKAKVFSRKDNRTPEVLTQRAKMKTLIELSRRMLPVVRIGFRGASNMSSSNAFVSSNMKAVKVEIDEDEHYVGTVDFEKLLVAFGMLDVPEVEVSYDAVTKEYSFQQTAQEEESGYVSGSDQVYAMLFETGIQRLKIIPLRKRRESGSTSFALPKKWDSANVKAYCFAVAKGGSNCSESVFLTIG